MKIGLITIVDDSNYGNRLQNYAVNEIIKSYGMVVETIWTQNNEMCFAKCNKGLKSILKQLLPKRMYFFCVNIKSCICGDKLEKMRKKHFKQFTLSRIPYKKVCVTKFEELQNIEELKNYDYFVTGSDQVWNPYWAGTDFFFLDFAPPEKRIAFIASIGVTELPNDQKERYTRLLKQMKYISVREEAAVELIEQLTNRKVDCFFDPVLLVNKNVWYKLAEPVTCFIPDKYVLSFFLGEEYKKEIDSYANGKHLSVVYMNNKEYEEYYILNPAQLLYMIQNAEIIFTDSFHVTAFSIIFQKQFLVFKRREEGMENMFSRMETLLGRLDLMDRIHDNGESVDKKCISNEKFADIHKILKAERSRFDSIMKDVLK